MDAIILRRPSKPLGAAIALSLAIHALIIGLLQFPSGPISDPPERPVVFEFTRSVPETPVKTLAPPATPVPQKAEPAAVAAPPEPQVQAAPQPEPSPGKSIMFEHTQHPSDVLGLSRALSSFGETQNLSGPAIVQKRMDDIRRRYEKPLRPAGPRNAWAPALSMAAREGTAFYAAYAAHNTPAMLAVTGLSLTKGSLRKGLNAGVGAVRSIGRNAPEMADGEAYLVEQVARHAPVTARDLYMQMPPGWTYTTLREKLDNMVKDGKLKRLGKGHRARYLRD